MIRVFFSIERLLNQLRINGIREDRELVAKTETNASKIGKSVKKSEMDDPKVGKIGEVGELVKRIETGGPQARTIVKKVETGDTKVVEFVKKIQINDPKVGKVWKLVRFGQEKHKK